MSIIKSLKNHNGKAIGAETIWLIGSSIIELFDHDVIFQKQDNTYWISINL